MEIPTYNIDQYLVHITLNHTKKKQDKKEQPPPNQAWKPCCNDRGSFAYNNWSFIPWTRYDVRGRISLVATHDTVTEVY